MAIGKGGEAGAVAGLAARVRNQCQVTLPAPVLTVTATARYRFERFRCVANHLADRTEHGRISGGVERVLLTDRREDIDRLGVGMERAVTHPVAGEALAAFDIGVGALDGGREPNRSTAVKCRVTTGTCLDIAVWPTDRSRHQPMRLTGAQCQKEESEGRDHEIPDGKESPFAWRTNRDAGCHRSAAASVLIRPVGAGPSRAQRSGALPAVSLAYRPALGLGSALPLRIRPATARPAVFSVSTDPVEGGPFVAARAVIEILEPAAHEDPPEKANTNTICAAISRMAA